MSNVNIFRTNEHASLDKLVNSFEILTYSNVIHMHFQQQVLESIQIYEYEHISISVLILLI